MKLVDVVGPAIARELLFLGDPVPASLLAKFGIIARAVPADEVEQVAQQMIDRVAANAPLSLRAIKAALVRAAAVRAGVPHGDVDELINRARRSEDAREGMRARLEKRTPEFLGR